MDVDFGKTRDGKYQQRHWPQLLHRKITPRLIDDLEATYPDFDFEICTLMERRSQCDNDVDPYHVYIITDTEGIVIRIPTNG